MKPQANARLVNTSGQTVAVQGVTREFATKFVNVIRTLEGQKTGKFAGTKGIHTVYSGLNQELRRIGMDPIATVNALVALNVVSSHPTRGGAMVYVKGEEPVIKGKAFGLLG